MKDTKIINSAVRFGGLVFQAGEEDQLNEALPTEDVQRLLDKGVLGGEGWTGTDGQRLERGTPLPDDFPARKTLTTAGFGTVESLRTMSAEQFASLKLKPETRQKVADAAAALVGENATQPAPQS